MEREKCREVELLKWGREREFKGIIGRLPKRFVVLKFIVVALSLALKKMPLLVLRHFIWIIGSSRRDESEM